MNGGASTALNGGFARRRQPRRQPVRSQSAADNQISDGLQKKIVWFLAVHALFGVFLHYAPSISSVHAYAVFGYGVYLALFGKEWRQVAFVGAYIVGSEVVWRMTEARVYWEFGKYAVSFVLLAFILLRGGKTLSKPALVYFALLCPAVILTLGADGLSGSRIRGIISFNMSGPFALLVCSCFFAGVNVSRVNLVKLFAALLGPIVTTCFIAFTGTYAAEVLTFTGESNFETSGGFGPNQVSMALSAGVLSLYMLFLLGSASNKVARVALSLLFLVVAFQCTVTFSRTGIFAAAIAVFIGSAFLAGQARQRSRMMVGGAILFGVVYLVMWPFLVRFTSGAIEKRYAERSTTLRLEIFMQEIAVWEKNILFGVGPGMGPYERMTKGRVIATHSELSRMFSEHGLLGVAALFVAMKMGYAGVMRQRGASAKAIAAALLTWTVIVIVVNGMRLALPCFVFGLLCMSMMAQSPGGTHQGASEPNKVGGRKQKRRRKVWRNEWVMAPDEPAAIGPGELEKAK